MADSTDKEAIISDRIHALIEEISGEYHVSACAASGIVATIMMEPNIQRLIPLDLKKVLENNILAACTGDNKYLFREAF